MRGVGTFGGTIITKGAELGPSRTPWGKLWNDLVHRYRPARWVDEWWYERARIPCEVGSFIAEGLAYGVGFGLLGLPAFAVLTAARFASNIDEIHIMYLAARHHDFSLFDKAQTWQRTPDGRFVRMPDPHEAGVKDPTAGVAGVKNGVTRFISDFWTERRRLPGFILGIGSPIIGFVLGAVFHAPLLLVGVVTYATFGLQMVPVVRNGFLSALHGTLSYLNQPQRIPRKISKTVILGGPERTIPGPAMVASAELTGVAGSVAGMTSPASNTPVAPPAIQPRLVAHVRISGRLRRAAPTAQRGRPDRTLDL